ncbi:hypothetical protein E0H73_39320 [Kribbella pittospori]|uniref:Uncharacterized protein n=1 Tax=Kribbella pittospori TaxID=722689 RepID=A0A4R0K5X2_9ACTN|nr:hypothetical protein [Kribbella pittospori]TCC54204.1 hypothetical protein E0H73_39320 [Kribbella pittospori]
MIVIVLCGVSLALLLAGVTYFLVRRARSRRLVNSLDGALEPIGPPIEEIAVSLRQLLQRHDRYARSDDRVLRLRRMSELESVIHLRADQAARALDVPHPARQMYDERDTDQLRLLLFALVAAGLVLPTAVALMAPDSRF